MNFTFDNYFEWLIPWEGSVYENHPNDPGGATKFGIDQRSHPDVNIRRLTRDGAKKIYWEEYWLPVSAHKLPARTAWAVVDCGVNCGKTRAAKWLQEIVGVAADGVIGPITIKAAKAWNDKDLAAAVLVRREAYYRALAKQSRFKVFLKGWLNRNNSLKATLA